jgi:hypothetical protein
VELASITALDIVELLEYLRNEYEPKRLNGDTQRAQQPDAAQHLGGHALVLDLGGGRARRADRHGTRSRRRRRRAVETAPLTQADIKAPSWRPCSRSAPITAEAAARATSSSCATGRSSSCCWTPACARRSCAASRSATSRCKTGRISVQGQGAKHRYVWAASVTRQALWQYLSERAAGSDPAQPLFLSAVRNRAIGRRWLSRRLKQLGERAGVDGVFPHRFRHTFAVQYLRNGGDVFTLQILLGHSSAEDGAALRASGGRRHGPGAFAGIAGRRLVEVIFISVVACELASLSIIIVVTKRALV